MVRKIKDAQEASVVGRPVVLETSEPSRDLRTRLDEVKNYEGVIGYILRNSSSASINLKDPAKIVDYAILSSSVLDAGKDLAGIFNLGDLRSITVEGELIRTLSMDIDENKISVFMEKSADNERVMKRLCLS